MRGRPAPDLAAAAGLRCVRQSLRPRRGGARPHSTWSCPERPLSQSPVPRASAGRGQGAQQMIRMVIGVVLAIVLATAPMAQAAGGRQDSAEAKAVGTVVNLNTATASQLEALWGSGQKMAQRMVDYGQKNGALKKVEELINVKAIGEKSFLKLKPQIPAPAPKG